MSTSYLGFNLVEAPDMVIPGPNQIVTRTWKERLLTLPWRPLKATKSVPTVRPNPKLYQLGPNLLVGHPEVIAKIKEEISNE